MRLVGCIIFAPQSRRKPFALRSLLNEPSVIPLDALRTHSHRVRPNVRRVAFDRSHHDKCLWRFIQRK